MKIQWAFAAFLLFSFVNVLNAELMLRPPGLEDGDQYRLIFTISRTTNALSGEPDFYHNFVQTVADEAPVVGNWGLEWRAMMAVGSLNMQEASDTGNLDAEIPIYRIDGVLFVENYRNLYEGFHNSSLGITELDTVPHEQTTSRSNAVWTGTRFDGREGQAPIGTAVNVTTGNPLAPGPSIFESLPAFANATEQGRVYAISSVITVPEPTHGGSAFLLFVILYCVRLRHRREVCLTGTLRSAVGLHLFAFSLSSQARESVKETRSRESRIETV